MATDQVTIDKILAKSRLAGDITAKKMFGEFGLFCEGKMFAIVGDDQLFVKATEAGDELYPDAVFAAPYPGAKPCLMVPEEKWSDEEWFAQLILETTRLLPIPKKKKGEGR